jgi:two-component system sensor histidine kinase BaeS
VVSGTQVGSVHLAFPAANSPAGRGVRVRGDVDRLHQALGNLLDNAERYARIGDSVTVRVSAVGTTAVLQVADTGPGIPADTLPRVFDRLWRGPDQRDVPGSGIGLASSASW